MKINSFSKNDLLHQFRQAYVLRKAEEISKERMSLFKTNQSVFESEGFKKSKRVYSNKPISAYNSNDWFDFYKFNYENEVGDMYPSFKKRDSMTIKSFVYPLIFDKYRWSAREFASFLIFMIKKTKKRETPYVISFIPKDEEGLEKYTHMMEKRRSMNFYDRSTHIPHIPMSEEDNDILSLLNVFDVRFDTSPVSILCSYGIPIFHRYLQIERSMSPRDATKKIKSIFADDILMKFKNNREVIEKIFCSMAKSSILWEPCTEGDPKKNVMLESTVSRWREELSSVWKKFGVDKLDWWEPLESRKTYRPIPGVIDFFDYKLRKK